MPQTSFGIGKEENAHLQEENQQLLHIIEERNAELAILQSVQEGLASKLDMQSIYDLVGDKIREIFHDIDVEFRMYDHKTNFIRFPYFTDRGQRMLMEPIPLPEMGISSYVLRTGKTLVINENLLQVSEKFGSRLLPGGHPAKSAVFVPLIAGSQACGLIVLGNAEREQAFSESDVRLLETLASSMSTALENARLFDETQHLLKETEQRAAELAIINSVQEGLASKLEVQAIYELVGNKIRDIFRAQGAAIYLFDHTTEILDTPYCYLKQRFEIEPRPFLEHPIAKVMAQTAQPIIYRTVEEYRAIGGRVLENSEEYKSGMYVPMIVGKELKGMVGIANLDVENAYTDSDLRLLQTLANSLSVALENARLFDETQRLLRETEQRNAELAIINSVQEGLASKLDIQSIYELVGEQLHQVFPQFDVSVAAYDPEDDLVTTGYMIEHGRRIDLPPFHLENRGFIGRAIRTRKTVLVNENLAEESRKIGSLTLPGTDRPKSHVIVPLIIHKVVRGLVVMQDMQREYAFLPSDIRLLETIANSMSIALENARLFDETQRLLRETEQRAAELQIINSVQEGLASKLDMQAIYDLVGDKIRELFNAQSVWIQTFDQAARTRQFRYGFYNRRLQITDILPYNKLIEHLIATRKPLVINQDAEAKKDEFEMVIVAGSELFKSAVFVPLIAGGEVKGLITLQNMEQENAFSEPDVNLLSTLASSMSVALENARLFDETQRLLKETEQRNAELAIINSVQAGLSEGLASNREIQSIYDLVGDKIRELFPNTDTEIRIYDPKADVFQVPYYIESGQRVTVGRISLSDATISAHVLRTGQTLVVNENVFQVMEKYGARMMHGRRVPARSVIFVPLMVGSRASGIIVLNNVEREHAFSQSDVRLLQTLASSMSTALENARLFDETQRLFLEAEVARTTAEQADQAKGAFLSSMSHELRTPLNAIINFVEMVARGMIGPVNQEQVELLDQALHSSKHLLNLINDVLDISKIQAGQLTLFIEQEVSVQVEVEAALNIAGGLMQEKGLHLIRDIDPHLPLISCDRRRVRQVLLNLIGNAIKFTSQGTVTVSVKDRGEELLFAVIDTGPGIPPDKQNLIFEPFLQAENGERQMYGTGLGLPISRSLVRAHGGILWVESEPGEGSAFYFTIPVEQRSNP